MGLQRPELFLLLLPAAWLWWRTRDGELGTRVLRALTLLVLVLALAGPYLRLDSPGRDLVVVVDRSRSMPEGAEDATAELLRLAEEARSPGDRVAIVTFGTRAAVERPLSEDGRFDGFARHVLPDGSDLAAALETALEILPEERRGSILLLSDGELRGRDPLPVARRAFARDVRIDVRSFTREGSGDLAVESLDLPEAAASGEPFQFSAWIHSDEVFDARYELERGGEVIARGERRFGRGRTRLVFRDVVDEVGVATYRLHVLDLEDRVPENDSGLGALRIDGPRQLLVVNHDGQEDSLVRALRRSGLRVACAAPESAPLDRVGLEAYRAVILENVAASRIGSRMRDLERFVVERGGGLLVTGGRASFGIGGYYLSPLDEVLPVSMELRKEQREQGIALAIAMDRSGSMGAQVAGGTKMDLANMGSAAAIELLSELDSVAVIAVDTAPDVVQEMTRVSDAAPLVERVLRISPGGGGINTFTALVAAAAELNEADQQTKHITLFADAADANEQEGCWDFATELYGAGVTISVIALGTPGDPHAPFLKRLAELGGGEAYFTTQSEDLPRLFAQDTLTATRATFVDEETEVVVAPDLYGLGNLPVEEFPTIGGYNLCYLRPGATAGLVAKDRFQSPIFAFHHGGLGRAAAYTGQIGGTYGATVVEWPDFAAFFVTVARWLIGQEPPSDVHGTVYREGREAVVRVEVDPQGETAADLGGLEALLGKADADAERRSFLRLSASTYEARFPLEEEGIALPTLKLDERRAVRLAPLALPYSPEHEPNPDPGAGERRMRAIAAASGGEVAPAASTLFRGERVGSAWRAITRELLLAALLLALLEIAFRRLALWSGVDWGAWRKRASREERALEAAARDAHGIPVDPAPEIPARGEAPRRKTAALSGHAKLADAMERARSRARRESGR